MASKGRAYLVGGGYSLTASTLDALAGEASFSMNNIAGIFGRTLWRPTYYVMVTTRYKTDPEFRERAERAVAAAELSFVDAAYKDVEFFKNRDDVVFVGTHEGLEWGQGLGRISKYATSMLAALQIAAWLGYGPLFLLGVDGYRLGGANHFAGGEYNTNEIDVDTENAHMREAYEFAKAHCPVSIYDLTESEGYGVFDRL